MSKIFDREMVGSRDEKSRVVPAGYVLDISTIFSFILKLYLNSYLRALGTHPFLLKNNLDIYFNSSFKIYNNNPVNSKARILKNELDGLFHP